MSIIEATELTTSQKEAILQIWNREYPEKLKYHSLVDFENYLDKLIGKKHYLLAGDHDSIKGWAFTFTRDNEKWFAILLDQSIHRKGIGTLLLNKLKESETILNGWAMDHEREIKSNGEGYRSPLGFYLKNNFLITDIRLETEQLSAVKIIWRKKQDPTA